MLNLHLFDRAPDNAATRHVGRARQDDRRRPRSCTRGRHDVRRHRGTSTSRRDGQTHTASAAARRRADWHLFTLWPHMHQIGTHQSWSITPIGRRRRRARRRTSVRRADEPRWSPSAVLHADDQTAVHVHATRCRRRPARTACSQCNHGRAAPTHAATSARRQLDRARCASPAIYKYPAGRRRRYGCVNEPAAQRR